MLWPGLAVAACLIGSWYLFTHDLRAAAMILGVVAFGLLFLLGRRIEGNRDAQWQEAARQVQGSFRSAPGPAYLGTFGAQAPWTHWARHGELQCQRAIDGGTAEAPFALLHVRYSVRENRGETSSEDWYEVAVAVVRTAQRSPAAALEPVDAGGDDEAVRNGEYVFVWKKGKRGAGELVAPAELPALLQQARRIAGAPGSIPR
jgi:hypothetical protein